MYGRLVRASLLGNRSRAAIALASLLIPTGLVTAVGNFALDAESKIHVDLARRGPNVVADGDLRPPGVLAAQLAERVEDNRLIVGFSGNLAKLREGWEIEGTWPEPGQCLVGSRLADRDGVRLGDRFLRWTVSGILTTGDLDEEKIFVPLDGPATRTELRVPGSVEEIEAFAATLPGGRVVRQIAESEGRLASKLVLAFGLVSTLVLLTSALSMATALMAAVVERRREIALVKALGAGDPGILKLLAGELAAVGGVGVVAGSILGWALSDVMGRAVFGLGTEFRVGAILAGAGSCALVSLAGALFVLRAALRVHPARVLREE